VEVSQTQPVNHPELARNLAKAGFNLDTTTLTRALYSSDSSLQRVVPAAVARPESVAQLAALVDAALAARMPITSRGAGTSIAGNAVGPGLVIDCRDLNQIAHLDSGRRAAIVEPGVIPTALNAAAFGHQLRFGPDPSTVDRCTIGGMIGNNACGARALGYGRTADNLLGLDVITGTGERLSLASPTGISAIEHSPTLGALHAVVQANLELIRTEFGRFSRQVSGYSLEHLLPEHGFDVARFLAGSEGTLAVITGARVRLVPNPPHSVLVAIGYPDMATAAEAMPVVLPFKPTAAEGLDHRIVDVLVRKLGEGARPQLPLGNGWLLIELTDSDPNRLAVRAQDLLATAGGLDGEVVTDSERAARLWRIRADGAGLAAVGLNRPAHSGWEDSAVPPAALGAYLRDLDALLATHGLQGLPYGHFGEGCVHLRIDFDLSEASGVAGYRAFVEQAADLVASYGGSISGEHGDGRARSELLDRMYSPAALAVFTAVKEIFDPNHLLNPGIVVDPRPLDADLRLPAAHGRLDATFSAQVHRCTGVGKCLATTGAMCPSYQATGREQDSTRGRARTLQESVNGQLIRGGWGAPEVAEALELCLACKACASECPTGTDIAAAKSTVLAQTYRGRVRPRSHYALGWLPIWGRLVTGLPGASTLVNLALATPGLGSLAKWAAGVDKRRTLPRFARRSARGSTQGSAQGSARGSTQGSAQGSARHLWPSNQPIEAGSPGGRPVVVWVDPFTDSFDADRVEPLLTVLAAAGFTASVLPRRVDSGVQLISTGQRRRAAATLTRALSVLYPIVASGVPIVGLDPSCLAVWRSDAAALVDDPRLSPVRDGIHTLAELLTTAPDWTPPDLGGVTVVAQPHCHHAAVLGWAADAALLARTGATIVTVEGCCGLAGNFGMEIGHYDISVAVASNNLLPAIEAAGADAVLLADGFSCRYQVLDLTGRRAVTLAELLALNL
jgi:FAD/FMN-containing dehydrogenase/Fe-S oxidoreductase